MPRSISILGSTGSIGVSTLRVVRSLCGEFSVYGLSCRENLALLKEQIMEFHPQAVAISSPDLSRSGEIFSMKKTFPRVEFMLGDAGVEGLARRDVDVLVSAIVGAAGLRPTLSALGHAKRVALANKETLVMAGDIFIERAKERGVELIPVDSEHSAVFSLLERVKTTDVRRIILTASGGSLRDRLLHELDDVTPQEALDHPTWNMGSKITIDSATLMNKGLEIIEAHHLFNMSYDNIDVVIHPESIIHSMIEMTDNSIFALLSVPDMAFPILNALAYPEKLNNSFGRLNFGQIGNLTFREYDVRKNPAVGLCYRAGRTGGTMPAVLNAANEIAVDQFLKKSIKFTDIVKVVEKTMDLHKPELNPDIEEIFLADGWARDQAKKIIRG